MKKKNANLIDSPPHSLHFNLGTQLFQLSSSLNVMF